MLFDTSGSPIAASKPTSPTSPSQAPRPLILFEGDEEEEDLKRGYVGVKFDSLEPVSPKLEDSLKPTLTPGNYF